jgi:hypothetical protein
MASLENHGWDILFLQLFSVLHTLSALCYPNVSDVSSALTQQWLTTLTHQVLTWLDVSAYFQTMIIAIVQKVKLLLTCQLIVLKP